MLHLQKLSLGTQDFKRLREDKMLYVDKTEYIYHLITNTLAVFLPRPRRFGKSLLCSTLRYLFEGERDLFKGLWLDRETDNLNFKWTPHPVIHLDLSRAKLTSVDTIISNLYLQLEETREFYQIPDSKVFKTNEVDYFQTLISALHRATGRRVVVLIDEYDAPIVKKITRPEAELEAVQELLRNFYGVLKGCDAHLKFLFLTGISKFTKVSVFSALNNLQDVSLNPRYAALLGYTQTELESYFKAHIQNLAEAQTMTYPATLQNLKVWYNGYRFTNAAVQVYNPYSLLNCFANLEFDNYWFESGSPKLLLDLVRQQAYDVRRLNFIRQSASIFRGFEPKRMKLESLFYSTGYLTIKRVSEEKHLYEFGFPNREVRRSFYWYFMQENFLESEDFNYDTALAELKIALESASASKLKSVLYQYFTQIPYPIQVGRKTGKPLKEYYYQSLLYVLFYLASVRVAAEDYTNLGRIDLVCQLPKSIYLFELKVDQTADVALAQIKTQKYYEKYRQLHPDKTLHLVGLNFNTKERNLDSVKIEKI